MNFGNVPLEKVWSFLAVIPGAAVMLIFRFSHPEAFSWFYSSAATLGYRTRITLLLMVALIIGHTLTSAINFCAGAIGGVIGSLTPYKPSDFYDIAPWRDPTWRALVSRRLGPEVVPGNIPWVSNTVLEQQKSALAFSPEADRTAALSQLMVDRMAAITNDTRWREWYSHYHAKMTLTPGIENGFAWHLYTGLSANLEATALYILIAHCLFNRSDTGGTCYHPSSGSQ